MGDEHRIGIVGHRDLRQDETERITTAIKHLLDGLRERHGASFLLTSLAPGADLLGAEAAARSGIGIRAVLPADTEQYFVGFPAETRRHAERILATASAIERVPAAAADENIFQAPARRLVDASDELIAVWNGEAVLDAPGGTCDSIERARTKGIPVFIIPATRSGILPGGPS